MHDIDGRVGLVVKNGFGDIWKAYGDGYLYGPDDSAVLEAHQKFVDAARKDPASLLSTKANSEQAKAAVAEAVLLVHYYAQQSAKIPGWGGFAEVLQNARGLAGDEFVGDNLAPKSLHFPPPTAWLQK